ncbi:hypothetical protein CEP52_016836, partial [Fusarium oligoseptatum]
TALIIIPEEAELLLPMLRDASKTAVSLLTYATPVTKSMWQFNTLTYFTMPIREKNPAFPQWLSIEIGILAGRLYFDYSEYTSLVEWLGIRREAESPRDLVNRSSGETVPVTRGLFIDQPLKFLLEWLTYRRQTMDIMHTPMGYVCQKRSLHSEHSFFTSATTPRDADEVFPGVQGGIVTRSAELVTGDSDDDSDWGEVDDDLALSGSGQMKEQLEVDE